MQYLKFASRFTRIDIPIYTGEFLVCSGSEKETVKFIKKELGYEHDGEYLPVGTAARCMTLYDNDTGVPIWVLLFPKKVRPSTLIHELYHLTTAILRHADVADEESGAYLIEWLYRQIVK